MKNNNDKLDLVFKITVSAMVVILWYFACKYMYSSCAMGLI